MGSSICIRFDNNQLLPALFGEQNEHLKFLEKELRVDISSRGNVVAVTGRTEAVEGVQALLKDVYERLVKGRVITLADIEAAARLVKTGGMHSQDQQQLEQDMVIKTINRLISPYSNRQKDYIKLLHTKEMVFAQGPAGTGKTYLAVAVAVSMYLNHKVDRIILSRPAIEAGEKIGFLPGDMKEKIDPYMQPLYDALHDMLPTDKVNRNLANGVFEIAPLAFMRGRTLKNAFVILDEAQNATPTQMKMFLTRLGEGSRMVINGDLTQVDLPTHIPSGLREALTKLKAIEDIGFMSFDDKDVIRHSLVAQIIRAYHPEKIEHVIHEPI